MIFYNVLIGGISVGMTPHYKEAEGWVSESMFKGTKEIRPVKQQN